MQIGLAILAWAILLVALLPHSHQQQEPRTVHVANGQQLADAVADWGLAGGDLVIQVDSWYLSLENVTIRQLQPTPGQRAPFSSGKLKLVGQWDGKDNRTIINTAMRQLTPPLSGATAAAEKVVIINNCEDYVTFASPQGPELVRASFLGLFPFSFFYTSVTYTNSIGYVRQVQIASQVYLATLWRLPLGPAARVTSPLLSSFPAVKVSAGVIDSDGVYVARYQSDQAMVINSTVVSMAGSDPLLLQLRDQGLILAPRFCNGTLLPQDLALSKLDVVTPAWLTDNTPEFLAALVEATAFTWRSNATDWAPMPLVYLGGDAILIPDTKLSAVRGPLLLVGPFNDVPEMAVTVVLDLQQGIDTIRLGPTGKLLMHQLSVSGLGLRTLNPSFKLASALPMAAISPPPGSNPLTDEPHVWMHNVTLMLPPNDFLAVTSLALANTPNSIRDCVGPDVRALADELQGGIRSMSVAGVDVANQWLVLSSFVGWGLNATSLKLVPERSLAPLDGCSGGSQEKRCGRLRCGQLAGLLVGLISGACVLVGAVLCFAKQHAQETSDDSKQELPCEPIPQDVGTPQDILSLHTNLCEQLSRLGASSTSQTTVKHSTGSLSGCVHFRAHARHLVELRAMELNDEADKVFVTGVVAQGSSGIVFQGVWRGLTVALKTVVFEEMSGTASDQANSRAVVEAAISASLSHPNIVATYRYDIKPVNAVATTEQDKLEVVMGPQFKSSKQHPLTYKLYLVQEFCDFNLTFVIDMKMLHHRKTRAVDWMGLLQLLQDVARGLAYLHANSIIHGDLKPCNVLIKWHSVHKTRVVAKLADFGLSNHLQGNATHVSNFRAGTPFYVAPEVAKLGQTSPASDIYSLGMIMWEAASGCSLCIQSSGGQAISNPLFPAFPDHIQPVPAYVELLRRCIANDPQLRPSASDVIKQLQGLAKGLATGLIQGCSSACLNV